MGFEFTPDDSPNNEEWTELLLYICAKRTSEPAFQELFDRILTDEGHAYYKEARTLKMLYDFTPLRREPPLNGEDR